MRTKILWLLRHGQAAHNVRAEAARENGCSFDQFLQLMKSDDQFDAALTQAGIAQAKQAATHRAKPQLVTVSPLSRAINTAMIVFPDETNHPERFLCDERLRERNGWMLNAKRRRRSELDTLFPTCNFTSLDEDDTLWSDELEDKDMCARRAHEFLQWIATRPEEEVAIVAHGGLFWEMLNNDFGVESDGDAGSRFSTCELRRLTLTLCEVKGTLRVARFEN